ncbi:MAG: hypothetical protein B6I34_06955 [Anaerolineaceae bacterium 4572_32.1]|nr:MAG: hypothetical protein B6I34_06955 [Anaerolineaceae bacterium 4572_32.1]
MGYIDKLMGRNERIQFTARQHLIVLLIQILGSLFAFLVFVALGVVIRTGGNNAARRVAIVVLLAMLLPLFQIVMPIIRGERRSELFHEIWQPVLIFLFMLIMGLALLTLDANLSIAIIAWIISLFPLIDTVRIYLDWHNERYIVTNRRVMLIKGIINKRVSDSALEKVNDVVLTQSVLGRLLGYGDVEIITGSDVGVNLFKRISKPVKYKREMLNQKESLKSSSPDDDHESVPELLEKLDALHRQGILSDEEFEAKKQQLLDQI